MAGKFESNLAKLGVILTEAPAPAANYVPFVKIGDLVYINVQSVHCTIRHVQCT